MDLQSVTFNLLLQPKTFSTTGSTEMLHYIEKSKII